jgi:hypothetical protein
LKQTGQGLTETNLIMDPGTLQLEFPVALIDAHVHVYDCFDIHTFLDLAMRNFQEAALVSSAGNSFLGVLLLTETVNDNKFSTLKLRATEREEAENPPAWKFINTEEDCSLLAIHKNNHMLAIIAGRQIISEENLEILALGTTRVFPEHLPITDVLTMARASQALAVLPWGFGKWLAGRGSHIERLLKSTHHPDLFLGDNSGRPGFLPRPGFFKQAEQRNIRILPGSDPLPFPRAIVKPGSFGFILNRVINAMTPASDIKRLLSEPGFTVNPYGTMETPLQFARNQIAMQLVKYKR